MAAKFTGGAIPAMALIALFAAAAVDGADVHICLQQRLTPPWQAYNYFGRAVALDDDWAIIGAPWNNMQGIQAGAVFLARRDGPEFILTQVFWASDGSQGAQFGYDVAIAGAVTVAGAPGHVDPRAPGSGAAYVLEYNGAVWSERQKLLASDGVWQHVFGASVAVSEQHVVVGAPNDQAAGTWTGAAYVFEHDGTQWVEQQKLLAPDPAAGQFFADWQAVAICGDVIVIGARGHPGGGAGASHGTGAAFVYKHDGSQWNMVQMLVPDVVVPHGRFGRAVAISGDRLLVGAQSFNPVRAFLFRAANEQRTEWALEQVLFSSITSSTFGTSVAIDGASQTALVGAFGGTVDLPDGAVAVYRPDADGLWREQAVLVPQPDPWANFFGRQVAISGGTTLIGANGEDSGSGAAYFFDLDANPADLNCDGVVDVLDLLILLDAWGPCKDCQECPADLNGDCSVDVLDLLILLDNWG
jgi:hypothetical protein